MQIDHLVVDALVDGRRIERGSISNAVGPTESFGDLNVEFRLVLVRIGSLVLVDDRIVLSHGHRLVQ